MAKHEHNILIINDNIADIASLTQILGKEFNVFAERIGAEGINTAKRIRPSLILLDVIMPDMDGFDVIAALKKDEETKGMPVVFITGINKIRDEEQGIILGAADFVRKPFNPDVVRLRIKNQLQISSQIQMIHTLSTCDMLTGLTLRGPLNIIIDSEWRKASRMDYSIAFAIVNIDNFRQYNITHGCQKGDEALKYLTQIASKYARREDDRIGRWGDDEFALFLPATDLEGVETVTKNICKAIEQGMDGLPGFTVSIGAHSVLPELRSSYAADEFVADTIAALAFAKKNGKNQVSLFNGSKGDGKDGIR